MKKSEGYTMTKKIIKRRMPVMLMALLFAATFSVGTVTASDITGVTGSGGVFNIDPTGQITQDGKSIGFREYNNFTLDNGDTANLKFDSGINSFINMVNNQINIDGLVQTTKGGNFYKGEAIFVSPQGMVVGPNGVLNVGSLGVYTPTAPGMKMLKDGLNNGTLTATYKGNQINLLDGIGWHGNAPVVINGQINSAAGVDLVANQFTLGSTGQITSSGEALFGALVNFPRLNDNANGVNIRSYDRQNNGFMHIDGKIVNNGNSGVIIQNRGSQGLNVSSGAQIKTTNGELHLVNSKGAMNVAGTLEGNGNKVYLTNGPQAGAMNFTGKLNSNAGAEIYNRSAAGATIAGEIVNKGHGIAITSEQGVLNLNGKINNQNTDLVITNQGQKLVTGTNSNIDGSGKIQLSSKGADGMELNGTIKNSRNTLITNHTGKLTVNGTVENTAGKMNITQKGDDGLELGANSKIKSAGEEVLIQNVGRGGFTADGSIESSAATYLQNAKFAEGAMKINGDIDNSGKVLYIGNTSAGGLEISESAVIKNKNADIKIVNFAGNLDDKGDISNENGNIYLTNKGNGGLNVEDTAILGADRGKLVVQNFGTQGMTIDGQVENKGYTALYNHAGDMNINSDVTTIGARMNIQNSGNGALNINDTANITNEGMGRTYITNKGDGGMNIDADVVGGGHIIATNRKGGMNIHSKVTSTKANVVLTNTGEQDMVIDGTVRGNKVTAYSKGNDIVLGNKDTNQISINGLNKVSITTDNGSILNAGVDTHLIKSGGNLYMHANNGTIGTEPTGGIGADSRDLTKSVNVVVNGKVKAFTTDPNNNGTINIATKGHNLKVDRIKADGKVFLLTDQYVDADGVVHTGSILNRGTELDKYANVKGTTVDMISSGSIGTADRSLHFRQTDPSQKSNVLAAKDIHMHHRGNESGESVNFGTIKSKEGSIDVNLISDGVIDNVVAPGAINVYSRKENSNLIVNNRSNNPNVIRDYFDEPVKTATTANNSTDTQPVESESDTHSPDEPTNNAGTEPESNINSPDEPTNNVGTEPDPTMNDSVNPYTQFTSSSTNHFFGMWMSRFPDYNDAAAMRVWLSEYPASGLCPDEVYPWLNGLPQEQQDLGLKVVNWLTYYYPDNSNFNFDAWLAGNPLITGVAYGQTQLFSMQ